MITNNSNIPMALAIWLLHDEYDYINEPKYISVTKLMKPLKALVLSARVDRKEVQEDLEDYISRALGHSLHDSIEKAWKMSYKSSLKKLGYADHIIDRVMINPTPEELKAAKNPIPVYLEQRAFRKFRGYTIGGKFDMVAEGIVHDNKSTTAYSWVFGNNDENYQLQGSLYRWIDAAQPLPVITADFMRINFIFTDWQKAQARSSSDYPQKRLAKKEYPLLDLRDTEKWVANKIDAIEKYWDKPESEIPECSDEELWRSKPQYKYYADATKTSGRSTKNFDSLPEANHHWKVTKGGAGIVKIIPGEVKRCAYCDAAPVCEQRLRYL
ncbi:putative exonuclease [Erwinia phage phiEaP8]|uniref:Exonuclease n=2 Tax=Caudoviricetes TaxID=2731619 RepID=A0AB39ACG7_9CAUD|nr:exonuclease [Erwinia phage phiEaP8]AWN06219.1 putative exonuclease [Erwinia phage phiEaP8]